MQLESGEAFNPGDFLVNYQQPGSFFSPFLWLQKSFTIRDGKDANTSRSQGRFSKLIRIPKHQACFAFLVILLGGHSLEDMCRYLLDCLLGDIPIESTLGQQLPSRSPK